MAESEINLSPKQREQIGKDAATFREGINGGRVLLMSATRFLALGRYTPEQIVPQLEKAEGLINTAGLAGQRCLDTIRVATDTAYPTQNNPVELSALASFGTPDLKRLCDLLESSLVVAERIDAERGLSVGEEIPVQSGEARGMDLAEQVNNLLMRVRSEAYGAASKHE